MTTEPKVLAFAGSLRKDSTNKKILRIAVEGAKEAGLDITLINLEDYPLPIYNQEIEDTEGLPENALKLKKMMLESDAIMIASPEYNSSITGVLKNTIDWISRQAEPNEPNLSAFDQKLACLMATSPGGLGGLRGLVHLRAMLENIKVMVIPDQVTIPNNWDAFDERGYLKEDKDNQKLRNLGKKFAKILIRLVSSPKNFLD